MKRGVFDMNITVKYKNGKQKKKKQHVCAEHLKEFIKECNDSGASMRFE